MEELKNWQEIFWRSFKDALNKAPIKIVKFSFQFALCMFAKLRKNFLLDHDSLEASFQVHPFIYSLFTSPLQYFVLGLKIVDKVTLQHCHLHCKQQLLQCYSLELVIIYQIMHTQKWHKLIKLSMNLQ